jgi:hypothetical protein
MNKFIGCLGGNCSVSCGHVWGETMWDFVDRISYPMLIVVALLMLLAPFYPMPHVVEKIIIEKGRYDGDSFTT